MLKKEFSASDKELNDDALDSKLLDNKRSVDIGIHHDNKYFECQLAAPLLKTFHGTIYERHLDNRKIFNVIGNLMLLKLANPSSRR